MGRVDEAYRNSNDIFLVIEFFFFLKRKKKICGIFHFNKGSLEPELMFIDVIFLVVL